MMVIFIQHALAKAFQSIKINKKMKDKTIEALVSLKTYVTMGVSILKEPSVDVRKRDVSTVSLVRLGLLGVGEIGLLVSGLIPYCHVRQSDDWFNKTRNCVILSISIILMFDSLAIPENDAASDIERIAKAFLKPGSRKRGFDEDEDLKLPDYYFVNITEILEREES